MVFAAYEAWLKLVMASADVWVALLAFLRTLTAMSTRSFQKGLVDGREAVPEFAAV